MIKSNKLLLLIIFLVGAYFTNFFYEIIRYSHSSDWQEYKQYMWFFKDSVKNDIDTSFSYSYVKKRDIYNNIHYKDSFNIIIWEFKDLSGEDLNNVSISENVNLDNVKFGSGEILNKKSDLEITIKFGFRFNDNINIGLDEYSKLERNIKGTNYKGFYGLSNKITLSDNKLNPQIVFNYTERKTPTMLLVYKGHQSFYLIVINSEHSFDESIINILNLD